MTTSPTSVCVSAPAAPNALLVIGTYHSVMAGLLYRKGRLGVLFSIKHHAGSVSSIALSERYMASTGTDERIFLFTNKSGPRLADLGQLCPPCEARCLLFTPGAPHLLCGCADGQLLIYRTRDWTSVLTLPLHERAVNAIATHPTSGGALVVSVGADRRVAVVDLTRGRLITRWRYNPMPTTAETETETDREMGSETNGAVGKESSSEPRKKKQKKEKKEEKEEKEENEKEKEKEKRPREAELPREEPQSVCFSPSGRFFAICSHYAFAVHETATMATVAAFRMPQPLQPREELHCMAFVSDERVLFGNESGAVMECRGPWTIGTPCTLTKVELCGPQGVDEKSEKDLRHPTRHATRVKTLQCTDGMVFTADTDGVVIAWRMEKEGAALEYVCSTNCKGRVTAMNVLSL